MAEIKTVHKWWWIWNFDKEEQWLNEMAMQGWALISVSFLSFTFERCEPGEYIVRTELRAPDSSYTSFMEETGAEYIGRCFQWIYFRRKAELGSFDLFSDIDSRVSHLGRIYKMLVAIGLANVVIGIANSQGIHRLGWINLLCSTLLMYAAGRIKGRMDALQRERELRE